MLTALGDAVHALAVFNALKRSWPQAHITWITQPGPAALLRGHPAIDEILVFHRRKGWRAFLEMRRVLKGRSFDLTINLQTYLKAGVITWLTHAPVKLAYDRARSRDGTWLFATHRLPPAPYQHVQDEYLEFLTALGLPADNPQWNLGPWTDEIEEQKQFFSRFSRPVVALVIGTSKVEKDWPPERWAALAQILWDRFGLQPVLVGSQSEKEVLAANRIVQECSAPVVSSLGSSVRQMVGILAGSALTIAGDTGPLHVSVAVKTPVIALLGYSNPKRTGPYRLFHDLAVDVYANGGGDYAPDGRVKRGRMPLITVDMVVRAVENWEERYRASRA